MEIVSAPRFESEIARIQAAQARELGFRWGKLGTHSSRTLMLKELRQLLRVVPGATRRQDYADAILEENCLAKPTYITRRISLQRLTELYGLDRRILLFQVLRKLWKHHEDSHPLLALLLALARDPLLRATAQPVLATPVGHEFARQWVKEALHEVVGERLNEQTSDAVARNTLSSWTQSGHLHGRSRKMRRQVKAGPAALTFALLIAYLTGRRGALLFEVPWVAVLEIKRSAYLDVAGEARRIGLLDLKQAGNVLDISFPALLDRKAMEFLHGAHQ